MPKVVAKEVIHYAGKNGIVTVTPGQSVDAKDPVVKNNPLSFVDADDWLEEASRPVEHRPVEAATAAPGETRTVKKPKAAGKK